MNLLLVNLVLERVSASSEYSDIPARSAGWLDSIPGHPAAATPHYHPRPNQYLDGAGASGGPGLAYSLMYPYHKTTITIYSVIHSIYNVNMETFAIIIAFINSCMVSC